MPYVSRYLVEDYSYTFVQSDAPGSHSPTVEHRAISTKASKTAVAGVTSLTFKHDHARLPGSIETTTGLRTAA